MPASARFEAQFAIAFGQRQQVQTGTIAMLGMHVLSHRTRNSFDRGRANGLAPVNQPLRRPLHVRTVGHRHMRGDGGEAALDTVPGVTSWVFWPIVTSDSGLS